MGNDSQTNIGKPALGSAKKLKYEGGRVVAVPHPVKKSGYKAVNAYGASSVFESETTNKYFQSRVRTVGNRTDKKKLMPYEANAPRNRPKGTMENTPGKRFGFAPSSTRAEKYRGSSQVVFNDGDPTSKQPWKTTSQTFHEGAHKQRATGIDNQGIFADVSKEMHQKQGLGQSTSRGF